MNSDIRIKTGKEGKLGIIVTRGDKEVFIPFYELYSIADKKITDKVKLGCYE